MIKNANTIPKIYYGLHFCEGIAEYREPSKDPYRVLVGEETLKNMDPSFAGRPVYVDHVDEVDLTKLQSEADGYVVESFYNKSDGKHWAKFIVVSDRGHQALANGWRLSNAYTPQEMAPGGLWHGVEYQKEVKKADYDHLAIVPNPRYDESIVLSPEDFKSYNERKENELKRLTNELEGDYSMFEFFKRTKVENASDFENTMVRLPKSKKEYTISELVKNADSAEEKKSSPQMCNGEDMVKVGENTMSINELVAKHLEMMKPKQNDEDDMQNEEDEKKKNEEDEKKKEEELKKNEEEEKKKEEVKKNAADKKARFDSLRNAHNTPAKEIPTVECSMDQLQRGKSRYGSG